MCVRGEDKWHILVNSVDDIENCDFIFPSLIQRGKLSIGVMTGGASPVIGMDLKKQIFSLSIFEEKLLERKFQTDKNGEIL